MKNPKRAKQVKRIKRIRKWKKRSLILLVTFALLLTFLWILIYTSLGIKIITASLEKVMPEIQFGQVNGALNDLHVKDFSLALNGVNVTADKVDLSLSGLCLLQSKICVKNLITENVAVNIDTSAFPESPAEPEDENKDSSERFVITMPLPLELRNANLSNVSVNVDDMHFGLSSFVGQAAWVSEKIYIKSMKAMDVKAIFPDNPDTPPVKPQPDAPELSIGEQINQIFNKPLLSSLPTVNIPLDVYVNSLQGDNWLLRIGGEDFYFNSVDIRASTENNIINVMRLKTEAKTPYANADVKIKGGITLGDNWPVSADLDVATQAITEEEKNNQTKVVGHVKGNLLGTLALQASINGLNNADIDAKIDFIEKYMPVSAKVNGKHLQWPINNAPDYQVNDFSVDLSGSVDQYKLDIKALFQGVDLPDVQFAVVGNGTNEQINLTTVDATLPLGKFHLSGDVSWIKALKWNANVAFNSFDLTEFIPEYPLLLDGEFMVKGELDEKRWSADLSNVHLKGDVNKAPLIATGRVAVNSDLFILADKFAIKWGENSVKLNGSTLSNSLIADLDFTNLNVVEKGLHGSVSGLVKVTGSVNNPVLDSHVDLNKIIWQDIALEKATLSSQVEYKNVISGDLKLNAIDLTLPGLMVPEATITLNGSEKDHFLRVNMKGEPLSSTINLAGHFDRNRNKWNGSLSDTIFSLSPKNYWKNSENIELTADLTKKQASVSAHCWINNQSKLCLDNKVVFAEKGEASLSLVDIDLSLFDDLIQSETKLAGLIHGQAKIKWSPDSRIPLIKAVIDSDDVYMKQTIASQVLPIPFDRFYINADINDNKAAFNWNFSLKEFGKFHGNIKVDDPNGAKKLSGNSVIEQLSLSLFNPLLARDEHASGTVNSKLAFSGSIFDPYIRGNLDLEQSEITSTQLPVDIQSIMIDVDFMGKSSVLKGALTTQDGTINIDGKADWKTVDNWNASVSVKGSALTVNMKPMIEMMVIPNIEITANQSKLDMIGKVSIPKAKIVVASLPPSTIDVSSDEVMLDNNLQEIAPQTIGMKINTKLMVELGDKVALDAFGLKAKLNGRLFVTQADSGLSVNGQVNVKDGLFRAYGQDLVVKSGEIIFAGPVDLPRLNIEAIRNPESIEDNVTAGLRVTGLADSPRVDVFSEPAMTQQEALSYLLRGQGLESGEDGNNDMFTALLIGLGTSQGGKVLGSIGDAFGIKNLSLDSQGVGNSQKVVVSGYILPNLQLKYGVGIFDSLATFTLRYRLLPRLYLEAVSGLDQTLDIIYQFEF